MASYYGYACGTNADAVCMRSSFSDNSTLFFERKTTTGALAGHYYIVESVDDTFSVEYISGDNVTGTSVIVSPSSYYNSGSNLFLGSYAENYNSYSPGYCSYKLRKRISDSIFNKTGSNNGNIYYGVFNVKFNTEIPLRIQHIAPSFSSNLTYEVDIFPVDETRSVVIPSASPINTSVDYTSTDYRYISFTKTEITTSGTKVQADRLASNVSSSTFAYVVEFPEYNKYYFEGTVTEQGAPAPGRIVRAYRKDNGYLVDETTSASGTGYFYLETTYSGTHDVVCLDDAAGYDYNDLIYGDVIPTTISGI